MSRTKLLVYLLRRDLRVADNPILHHLATANDHGFTHLLPIYIFPAHQVEISGFLKDGEKSPYPLATSQVGKFWRCGPNRAKFLAESVWNLKINLEEIDSGLAIRVGSAKDVLDHLISELKTATKTITVNGVWMTEEVSWEEEQEQTAIATLCTERDIDFKIWKDEKYFVDDRDTGLAGYDDLPDIFTTYRKSQEPLREKPRKVLPRPEKLSLPTMLPKSIIPDQKHPFVSVSSLDDLCKRLQKPLINILDDPPPTPEVIKSSHSLSGGESAAWERLVHLAKCSALSLYKNTRNGLVGMEYSTKLSSFLALGCLTARQIHEELLKLENGTEEDYKDALGYGKGENEGTKSIRFELLWRDYMRLCTAKFGHKLFRLAGFRQGQTCTKKWKTPDEKKASPKQDPSPARVSKILERFKNGTTGMGLIDASQRELYFTGYTSNRARQNVASFFSKHLGIDWRYGAEWYEMLLVDYDVSSNWANWQYVAGVGNDPRGDARTFNPVKQAFDYDKDGEFVRTWIPELREIQKLEGLFQVWTTAQAELERCGLAQNIMAKDPIKKIEFYVDRKPRAARRPLNKRRGQQGGGHCGNGHHQQPNSNESGTSSDAAASYSATGVNGSGNSDIRNHRQQSRGATTVPHANGPTWRGSYMGGPPTNMFVCDGRGWYKGDHFGGGHGYGRSPGYWRPYGNRGGFPVRYQGGPGPARQMAYHPHYPGPGQ